MAAFAAAATAATAAFAAATAAVAAAIAAVAAVMCTWTYPTHFAALGISEPIYNIRNHCAAKTTAILQTHIDAVSG